MEVAERLPTMNTYYTLLGIEPEASQEAIVAAYTRQRDRYNPDRVAEMDDELRQTAEERAAAIERAYHVLSDPQRRRQYDASINLAPANSKAPQAAARRSLTARERIYAAVGVLVALALIGTVWVITGRNNGVSSQAMGEVNRPAPTFNLTTLDGGSVSLDQYRGQVVLVNFWGTWCEPCKRELPALEQAHKQLGDQGLAVVGVNLTDDELAQGTSEEQIKAFLDQFSVTYPIALDRQGEVTNAFRVFPLPTSFFIDVQGRIRYVHVGELTLDDVTARFTELKQEATALNTQ